MSDIAAQKHELTNIIKQIGYTTSPNALTMFLSPPAATEPNKIAVVCRFENIHFFENIH